MTEFFKICYFYSPRAEDQKIKMLMLLSATANSQIEIENKVTRKIVKMTF